MPGPDRVSSSSKLICQWFEPQISIRGAAATKADNPRHLQAPLLTQVPHARGEIVGVALVDEEERG